MCGDGHRFSVNLRIRRSRRSTQSIDQLLRIKSWLDSQLAWDVHSCCRDSPATDDDDSGYVVWQHDFERPDDIVFGVDDARSVIFVLNLSFEIPDAETASVASSLGEVREVDVVVATNGIFKRVLRRNRVGAGVDGVYGQFPD